MSNPNIADILLGFFGTGSENGEVSWKCDAIASDVAVHPEEAANVRQHLPKECRQ
jgi:hypothetical protein